jgi:3-mercaptopyruvate sulfurtransferase SseA
MTSKRAISTLSQLRLASIQCTRITTIAPRPRHQPQPLRSTPHQFTPLRSFSRTAARKSDSSEPKKYDYTSILSLTQNPPPNTLLIDVREPAELSPPSDPSSGGTIPTALNIPLTSAPDAYFLSAEEFEERFGFEKPGLGTEMVFFCKAGVRSRAAAQLAKRAGYEKVGEYGGSWMDWVEKGGVRERVK